MGLQGPAGLGAIDVLDEAGSRVRLENKRLPEGILLLLNELQETLTEKDILVSYLYDLGNPEARVWLTNYLTDFFTREGVDYYRQDFNSVVSPLSLTISKSE